MKITEDTKSRRWGIILWCDNKQHMAALDYIRHFYDNYIYILHDRDMTESGLKKPHYHVICVFDNQKKVSTLQNQLQIEINNLYYIKSLNGQLRYLIHFDDEDKFQYDKNDVNGSLFMLSQFKKALSKVVDENEQVTNIVEYIEVGDCANLNDLIHFVLDNELYSTFRRNYSMFKDLLYTNKYYFKKGVLHEVSTKSE